MKEEDKGYMQEVANETIETLESVSEQARQALESGHEVRADDLIGFNVATDRDELGGIQRFNQKRRESFRALRDEPAIARVVLDDLEGNRETYYISRATPLSGGPNARFASYRSPVGRFASLAVGQISTKA